MNLSAVLSFLKVSESWLPLFTIVWHTLEKGPFICVLVKVLLCFDSHMYMCIATPAAHVKLLDGSQQPQVPLPSAKSRTLTVVHQNRAKENWKMLLRVWWDSNSTVTFRWHKLHEIIALTWKLSAVQLASGRACSMWDIWPSFKYHSIPVFDTIMDHVTKLVTVTRCKSNRAPLGCAATADSLPQLWDAVTSTWAKICEECF